MHAHGEPGRRHSSLVLAALAMALVLAACTGDDDATGETTASSTTTTTTSTSSTTTTEPPDPTEDAAAVWEQAWSVAGERDSTVATLADMTTPQVADRLIATLHLGKEEAGDAFEGRSVTNHPIVEENDDGTFTIQDCLLISPSVTSAEANWYSGTIETIDGALKVTSVEPEVVTGCVPASIATEVYDAYDTYWEIWGNGTASDDPKFLEIITGEYREFIVPALQGWAAEGKQPREFPTLHPEIIEYRAGFVSISDCQDASPESGFYDSETGELLVNDSTRPPDREGTRNLREIQFVREDDAWKVSMRGGGTDSPCEPAPTPLAIAEVGE